ncbi:hypothetical protein [Massilia niastensis]|uniref:hypothetical protein n=1 Tax=Massilia niastensis TaxID=544911 RepID=UPI0027D9045F|nr:hypothetical protein [Massilia niastensis]
MLDHPRPPVKSWRADLGASFITGDLKQKICAGMKDALRRIELACWRRPARDQLLTGLIEAKEAARTPS